MSYWEQLRADAQRLWNAASPAEGIVQFQVELDDGTPRTVALRREVVPPDFEVILIDSPIVRADLVDVESAVAEVSKLAVGRVGYIQGSTGAVLTLGTTIPTVLLDPSQLPMFLLLVHMIAQAAVILERRLVTPSGGGITNRP